MMIRSGVSRWTMLHFGLAIAALLITEILFVLGFSDLLAGLRKPATLVGVHLTTIGWLSLLMLGALYQFVPVITNTRLYSQRLPLLSLLAIVVGLGSMLLGFLALGGTWPSLIGLLPIGGALVLTGFVLGAIDLWVTMWQVRPLPLPAVFVVFSLGFLLLTGLLGFGFTLAFALPHKPQFLLQLTASGLSLHLAAGLGGWFILTVMGVSYRLLSMFMLAPDEPQRTTHAALILTVAGLVLSIGVGLAGIWTGLPTRWSVSFGALLVALGTLCYLIDIVRFYRTRSRRHLELNSITAAAALALLALSLLAAVIAAVAGRLEHFAAAIAYLYVYGALTGLGLSQLYKIIPFLTWLEKFGPRLGKGPVPRVQDLVNETRARPWFVFYFSTALLAAACLAFGQDLWWRVLVGLQLVATLLIVVELWRSRHPDPDLKPTPIQHPGMAMPQAGKTAFGTNSSPQRSTT